MIDELIRNRALIWAFAQRDLSSRYRSSVLGWAWSLVVPLAFLLIYTVVFSVVFRVQAPPAGGSGEPIYVLFLFSGLIYWNAFTAITSQGMVVIRSAVDLLRKVHFPAFTPVVGATLVILVQVGIETFVLLLGLLVVGNLSWTWLLAVPVLVLFALFAQGVGLVLAAASARYGDIQFMYGILIQGLFFLTPVLYTFDYIPSGGLGSLVRVVAVCNPMSWYIAGMRDTLYLLQAPGPLLWAGMGFAAIGAFVLGWWVFQRRADYFSEEL